MITERTLKRWRKDALILLDDCGKRDLPDNSIVIELCKRILRLTSDLIDIHLLRKE